MRIWDRAISNVELTKVTSSGEVTEGLVLDLQFDEEVGIGDAAHQGYIITDHSGYGNHGYLSGPNCQVTSDDIVGED